MLEDVSTCVIFHVEEVSESDLPDNEAEVACNISQVFGHLKTLAQLGTRPITVEYVAEIRGVSTLQDIEANEPFAKDIALIIHESESFRGLVEECLITYIALEPFTELIGYIDQKFIEMGEDESAEKWESTCNTLWRR